MINDIREWLTIHIGDYSGDITVRWLYWCVDEIERLHVAADFASEAATKNANEIIRLQKELEEEKSFVEDVIHHRELGIELANKLKKIRLDIIANMEKS